MVLFTFFGFMVAHILKLKENIWFRIKVELKSNSHTSCAYDENNEKKGVTCLRLKCNFTNAVH